MGDTEGCRRQRGGTSRQVKPRPQSGDESVPHPLIAPTRRVRGAAEHRRAEVRHRPQAPPASGVRRRAESAPFHHEGEEPLLAVRDVIGAYRVEREAKAHPDTFRAMADHQPGIDNGVPFDAVMGDDDPNAYERRAGARRRDVQGRSQPPGPACPGWPRPAAAAGGPQGDARPAPHEPAGRGHTGGHQTGRPAEARRGPGVAIGCRAIEARGAPAPLPRSARPEPRRSRPTRGTAIGGDQLRSDGQINAVRRRGRSRVRPRRWRP